MNRRTVVVLALVLMLFGRFVLADTGVVIESHGIVRLKLPSGTVETANIGKKYPDGTTLITGADGKAVVVTEFGQVFRIGPNTTVKIGDKSGDTGTVTVSQGIILALRESLGGPQGGPRAHGAVKGLGSNAPSAKMNKRMLEKELKEVDSLPIETADARAMIKGQIYFRYSEYKKAIELLEPIYKRDNRAQLLRETLAKAYDNLGMSEQAAKFK